ncbi:MAG: peptidoglycan editing factor PgeF [Cyanobacteria bacterium P01_G01_bin.19]
MDSNQHWQWQTSENSSYLTCNLLSPWQHGFFTKEFYPHTPEKLAPILQSETKAYRVRQVHGNEILTPEEIVQNIVDKNTDNFLADGDGVISDRYNQSVWVASADCTPILIGDLVSGRVCAIHAGWRGTSQEIVVKAVSRFLKFGSDKQDLRIAIGPAIAGKIYQVDESVAVKVGKTVIKDKKDKSDQQVLSELKQAFDPPILDDELPGKVRLDVPRINQMQLEQLEFAAEQIAIARDFCTYQHEDIFFSYRRTGERKVQWSGILSNKHHK